MTDNTDLHTSLRDRFGLQADYRESASRFPESIQEALLRADTVAKKAATDYDLDKVYAAVSGGHDSQTALHVAHTSEYLDLDGVVYIDTTIGLPDSKDFARQLAEDRGLEFHVVGDDYRNSQEHYSNLVRTYGFPGPGVHEMMIFPNLKGKPLGRWLNEQGGNVGLISGVMEAESDKRTKNIAKNPIQEKFGATWISVLYDWLPDTVDKYRQAAGLEDSPIKTLMSLSGDCFCGCNGSRKELHDLKTFYPDLYEEIASLEREVVQRVQEGVIPPEFALYGHGKIDDKEWAAMEPDQMSLNLCSQCESSCRNNWDEETMDPATTAEKHHRADINQLRDPVTYYCVNCDVVLRDPLEHRQNIHPDAGASPKDLDIRKICPDQINEHWTQGKITTRNPDGEICDHGCCDVEEVDTPNGLAELKCTECEAYRLNYFGADEMFTNEDGEHDIGCPAPPTPDLPFEPQHGFESPGEDDQSQLSTFRADPNKTS